MITIALMGKYRDDDLIYALNSVMYQKNCELEMIISMNELNISVCDVIDSINGNRKSNLKRVLINTERNGSNYDHMNFISGHMTGDGLLCLWNGAALYDEDSLARSIIDFTGKEFVECVNVLYKTREEYVGERTGGIIFPGGFAKTKRFFAMDIEIDIKNQLKFYGEDIDGYSWLKCRVPLLKSYINYQTESQMDCLEYIRNNLPAWEKQIFFNAIEMNYSGYIELKRKLNYLQGKKEDIIQNIDLMLEYIIAKSQHAKWEMKNSDRACICHLNNIKNILKKRYWRIAIKRYLKGIKYSKNKKAVFVVNEYSLWRSCYKSVYDLLVANGYQINIVYTPFKHNRIEIDLDNKLQEWKRSGYAFSLGSEYNISAESPDVVFFCKPYDVADDKWCIKEIEKVIRWIVYIPYSMATMRAGDEIKRLMFQLPMHYIAWRQIVYSKICEEMLEKYSYNPKNKLTIGHPKYDIRITDFTEEEDRLYHNIKEKANKRKIILWNSHFAIEPQDTDGAGTFLNFGRDFLEYIVNGKSEDDYFVVWRPHPMFWDNMKEYSCMDQIEKLMRDGERNDRLFVDKTDSQWPAIFASDILVSDSSSLIESWIIYNKPLILTTRYLTDTPMDHILHKAISLQELVSVITDIIESGDKLHVKRKNWVEENYYLPKDGECVAARLMDEMEKDIFGDIRNGRRRRHV